MAKLRNCEGKHSPAKNFVNQTIHEVCPRYTTISDHESRFLVGLYLDCRESKTLPFAGSLLHQTSFAIEVFEFLDGIMNEYKFRRAKEDQKKAEDAVKKAKKGK